MDNLDYDKIDELDDFLDNLLLKVNIDNKIKKEDNTNCKLCNSSELVIDNIKGHSVCTNCGCINQEYLDENPEFNNDIENNTNSRYGCPTNHFFPQSSLGTKIVSKGYNRMSIIQKQGQMPYKEKSLLEVLEKIQEKCKKYNITQSIIDSAKILYKKISETKHTKGERIGKNIIMRCINRRSIIAACLFYACNMQKDPRSPKEIADIYDLDVKHVNRGCKKFSEIIINTDNTFFNFKSSQSTDFIDRYCKELNISKEHIQSIKDISDNIHKLNLASNHEPPSVAAGCILLYNEHTKQLNISKKEISNIFNISDVTILKTFRKISPFKKIICNNLITNLVVERKEQILSKNNIINYDNLIITDYSEDSCNLSDEKYLNTSSEENELINNKYKKNIINI
jgi:transcription initiation factor TFIIB